MPTTTRTITLLTELIIIVSLLFLSGSALAGCAFLQPSGEKGVTGPVTTVEAGLPSDATRAAPPENTVTEDEAETEAAVPPASEAVLTLESALAAPRAFGAEPFCMQLADTDGDGLQEWVGLWDAGPSDGAGVRGFILDGGQFYPLGAAGALNSGTDDAASSLLSEVPLCSLEIADLNVDGRAEIAVSGETREGSPQLTILAWNGKDAYPIVGSFAGDAGVYLQDEDGDGAREIFSLHRLWDGVLLCEVSRWNGKAYVYDRSYYALKSDFAGPLAVETAEQTLVGHYLNIQRRDFKAAYALLSAGLQARQDYRSFFLSNGGTRRLELGELSSPVLDGETWVFQAPLTLEAVEEGQVVRRRFAGEWHLREVEGQWRIDSIALTAQ